MIKCVIIDDDSASVRILENYISKISQLQLVHTNKYTKMGLAYILENQIDLLKSNYELNHPDKKEKNGFVQISKNNKIISLEDLQIGDEIQLQTPKYIGSCILNKLEKQ